MHPYTREQLKLRKHIKESMYENIADTVFHNAHKLYELLENSESDLTKLTNSLGLDPNKKHSVDVIVRGIENLVFQSLDWEYNEKHRHHMPIEYESTEEPRPRALLVSELDVNTPNHYKSLEPLEKDK